MYVPLINMGITNSNSKTVTIYEKMVRSKYKMQKSLNIAKGFFPYGNKIHVLAVYMYSVTFVFIFHHQYKQHNATGEGKTHFVVEPSTAHTIPVHSTSQLVCSHDQICTHEQVNNAIGET